MSLLTGDAEIGNNAPIKETYLKLYECSFRTFFPFTSCPRKSLVRQQARTFSYPWGEKEALRMEWIADWIWELLSSKRRPPTFSSIHYAARTDTPSIETHLHSHTARGWTII